MITSSSRIAVSHRFEDGWHIFKAAAMPGLYVANRDPQRAFHEVGPAIAKLVELDTGKIVQVVPETPFADFISEARADLTAAAIRQSTEFHVFQEAA